MNDLSEIVAELEDDHSGEFPERVLLAARRRREEITPRLIEMLERATALARERRVPGGMGHIFAIYLLAEFQAREALPAVLEAVSLPGDASLELFEDVITEDLDRILAILAADSLEVIEGLIVNRSLNEYVRRAAARTYLLLVRDGVLTRQEAVRSLEEQLKQAIAERDEEGATGLVAALHDFAPVEAAETIAQAYRFGLVDRGLIGKHHIDRAIAMGEAHFQDSLERCHPSRVDTVAELRHWACFRTSGNVRDPDTNTESILLDGHEDALIKSNAGTGTIRQATAAVGRNAPCPCGSGKKFKKCCGQPSRRRSP